MAKNAEYSIVINGIKESISAVESLNKQLDALEQRMDKLASKNINVSTSGGDGGARVSALDEEAKMLQQIEQLHQKVAATEKEEYQELLHAKEELKEYQTIAKSIAAQDNLKSGINDLNTMQGMKAQLHDLKAAMQTVDINGDQFKQWAAEANELTQKLKEAEASYGTFSRNVGNYSNGVADGLKQIVIKVGETERTFASAREASRTLNNELNSLSANGKRGTKEWKELNAAINKFNNDVAGTSAGLNRLISTMRGIVAIASVGKGISTLFGFDNEAIEQSIQKLVALQSVLQGLQTIQQQLNNSRGIGLWLSKGSAAADALAASLLKVDKGAAAASNSVKALSTSIKGGVLALVALAAIGITAYLDKIKKKFEEMKRPAEENAEVVKAGAEAYARAKIELEGYQLRINSFNGTRRQEKKLIDELNSKYGNTIGQYKTLSQWKDALIQKSPAFLQMLKNEAMAMANYNNFAKLYAEATAEEAEAEELINKAYSADVGRNSILGKKLLKQATDLQESAKRKRAAAEANEEAADKIIESNEKLKQENSLRDYAPQVDKVKSNSKEYAKALTEAENTLNALRIKLMKDGLAKDLKQLEENNRQELAKIDANAKLVGEELTKKLKELQEEVYGKERAKLINDFNKGIEESLRSIDTSILQDDIDNVDLFIKELSEAKIALMDIVDSNDVKKSMALLFNEVSKNGESLDFENAIGFNIIKSRSQIEKDLTEWGSFLKNYLKNLSDEEKEGVIRVYDEAYNSLAKIYDDDKAMELAQKKMLEYVEEIFLHTHQKEQQLIQKYGVNVVKAVFDGKNDEKILNTSLEQRINDINHYYDTIGNQLLKNINENYNNRLELIKKREEEELREVGEEHNKRRIEDIPDHSDPNYQAIMEANKKIDEEYESKRAEITLRYANERKKIEQEKAEEISAIYSQYYDSVLSSYSDFQSKFNKIVSRQPVLFKSGIINVKATKRQLREAYAALMAFKTNIEQQLAALESDFNNGLIKPEAYTTTRRNLQAMQSAVDEGLEGIEDKFKSLPQEIAAQVNVAVQALGNAANTLISSFGDLYNYNIQKELDALDEMNEKLQEKYDEQKEIEERHKNEIESIEDELANSRGDRRQQLIDQLNAEMQARREAAAEQKRIEAEMARNERKQEELDKKQRKAEYKRNLAQILVNGAMAVSQAAVNPWPLPAKALMALAAALTAAQYAIARKQKPYAKGGQLDGGVIKGKRHYDGGISVLGGRANVEGGEYITNRISTANNVALLDFVNSKKHKINLSELIDFYQSPKALKSSSKRVFADGGQLPTMPNIDLGDIMTDVAIVRDDRPIYVAVTDINKKQDDVRRVRTLAGL